MRPAIRRMIEGGAGAVEVACAACVSLAAARAMIARVRPAVAPVEDDFTPADAGCSPHLDPLPQAGEEVDGSPAGGAVAMERKLVVIEAGTTEPTAAAPLGGGPVDGSRGVILPPEKPRARPRSSGDDTSETPAGGMAVAPGAVRRATAAEAGNPGPTAVSSQNGGALVDGPGEASLRAEARPGCPPFSGPSIATSVGGDRTGRPLPMRRAILDALDIQLAER